MWKYIRRYLHHAVYAADWGGIAQEQAGEMFSVLTEAETATLAALLEKLAGHWMGMAPNPAPHAGPGRGHGPGHGGRQWLRRTLKILRNLFGFYGICFHGRRLQIFRRRGRMIGNSLDGLIQCTDR